jgi:hypothetical protein
VVGVDRGKVNNNMSSNMNITGGMGVSRADTTPISSPFPSTPTTAAATLPIIAAPPPPRERNKRRRAGATAKEANDAHGMNRSQASAAAGALPSAATPATSVAVLAGVSTRWADVLAGSQSYASTDPTFAYEVREEKPTFSRFLSEHFRPLSHIDLLKLAQWQQIKLIAQKQQMKSIDIANQKLIDTKRTGETNAATSLSSSTSLTRSSNSTRPPAGSTSTAPLRLRSSPFTAPSQLIFEPRADPSLIIPPLGIKPASLTYIPTPSPSPVPITSMSDALIPITRSAPSGGAGAAAAAASDEWRQQFGPCYLPSIANEPALLLQLGQSPAPETVDELQELVADFSKPPPPAGANSSGSTGTDVTSSPPTDAAAGPSTSVLVLLSNQTGRSTDTATANPSNSFRMSFTADNDTSMSLESSVGGNDAAPHILCEYQLSTVSANVEMCVNALKRAPQLGPGASVPADAASSIATSTASSLFSFTLSSLQPTNPPPQASGLVSVWSEVQQLAEAREEQLERIRLKRIREAELEEQRRQQAEERKQQEIEQAAARKQSVAAGTAAAAAATIASTANNTALSVTASSSPSTDDAQRMEIDGEPIAVSSMKFDLSPIAELGLDTPFGIGSMSLPPGSPPAKEIDFSTVSSPILSRSRLTTPAPSDPDQLLKELLSLQLQLAHQSANNAAHRRQIRSNILPSHLLEHHARIELEDKSAQAAYLRASRWQSIRLSMYRGTADVVLPPALLTYHRHKYSYDTDPAEAAAVANDTGEVFLDTSAYLAARSSDVELERALAAEAHALDDYSVCSVCFGTGPTLASLSEDDQSVANVNPLLFCEVCNVCVHQYCYGLASVPEESEWTCQWCVAHPEPPKPITLPSPTVIPPPTSSSSKRSTPAPSPPPSASAPAVLTPPTPSPLSVGLPLNSQLTSSNAMLHHFLNPQFHAATNFLNSLAQLTPLQLAHQLLPQYMGLSGSGSGNSLVSPISKTDGSTGSDLFSDKLPNLDMEAAAAIALQYEALTSPLSVTPPAVASGAGTSTSVNATAATISADKAKANAKAAARKNAALEKAQRKQREAEQAAETERLRVEAERSREATKRAERRQREEELPLPCCLCTVRGGALKPTDELDIDVPGYVQQQRRPIPSVGVAGSPSTPNGPQRLWAHILCALWLPRTSVADTTTMQPIRGVSDAWKFKYFKHGLPPATQINTEERKDGATSSQSSNAKLSKGTSSASSASSSSSSNGSSSTSAALPTNVYGQHALATTHCLTHINPLNLLTSTPGTAASNSSGTSVHTLNGGTSSLSPHNTSSHLNSSSAGTSFAPFSPNLLPYSNLSSLTAYQNLSFSNPFNFNFGLTGAGTGTSNASNPGFNALNYFSPTPAVEVQNAAAAAAMLASTFMPSPNGGSWSNQPPYPTSNSAMVSSDAAPASSSQLADTQSASIDVGTGNSNNFGSAGSNAPSFVLPLPALPLITPSTDSTSACSGVSAVHAAAMITTMVSLQTNSSLSSNSPRLLAASTNSPPSLTRAVSVPLISTSSPMLGSCAYNTNLPGPPMLQHSASTSAPLLGSKGVNAAVMPTQMYIRQNGVCSLCKKAYGCCVYCSADLCNESFHPLCAWYAGLHMRVEGMMGTTDVKYFLHCFSHTPLDALAIELVDATLPAKENIKSESEFPDNKRRKKVHHPGAGTVSVVPESTTTGSFATSPSLDRETTYFPWIRFEMQPNNAQCVSDFCALFTYRNKVRLLQQREYRNRGRQERTKLQKMQRKKRRLRLYGPQATNVAADGTPLTAGVQTRRTHVRTAADGTPIFDRSTRGESKLHCREDQYELGRCAVCFNTDEEIRSKEKWESDKLQRDWQLQYQEAISMGYAPPPPPTPAAPIPPTQPVKRKSASAAAAAVAVIPPHVAAFHASNPLLRCCECEIEVHSRCYGVQYEEVQAQLQAQERRHHKLQRVVKMGGGFKATSQHTSLSATALQQELDELHQQFEDELADELEEAEENTSSWRCRRCLEKDRDISCALCGRKGGAFKVIHIRTYIHSSFSLLSLSFFCTSFHAEWVDCHC